MIQTNTCYHFQYLPMGMRMLFTSTLIILGTGYLFAMVHIFASHAGRDGNPGISANDLMIAYSGSKTDTRLEAALKGPMANMLPDGEKVEISAWVRGGKQMDVYERSIAPIISNRCADCHDGSNPHIPKLLGYEDLSNVAEMDTGMDLFTLVRVSHIHLFGITFIFFILSSIFIHSYIKPLWVKCALIALPFLSIFLDIASWYLTKMYPPFAYVVIGSGALMGTTFAIQWITSMYQMWFYKLPPEVTDNNGAVS
ncbi:MAG: hypothetical protein OEX19_16070 [Gammaproteobacteria bacterium]|nr:hypothetical protein [Gammaproteobacteria bacterium]